MNPCAAGDCISLSRLAVAVPDGIYQGYSLANLRLVLEEPTQEVPLSASGSFALGPRALHATASFTVEGVPLVITGYNAGRVSGVALPRADTMTLNNLVFAFDDGVLAAALELNVNGTFVRHAPDAVIKVVDAPVGCTAPVAFHAASTDLDGDELSHVWWVPPWFLGTGTLLEASLPPGTYSVYLTSIDPSGRSDSTALRYVRSCQ